MTLTELLNSDVKTIMRTVQDNIEVLRDELATLVPQSLITSKAQVYPVLKFDRTMRLIDIDGNTVDTVGDVADRLAARDVTVLIDRDQALIRTICLPPLSRADLGRMLALNIERYVPLPVHDVVFSQAARSDATSDGLSATDIAAIPLTRARALADTLQRMGVRPRALRIAHEDHTPDLRFNFLGAFQAAGLIAKTRSYRGTWWSIVLVLAALNFATIIWRDSASVARWESVVEAQRPAVSVAQQVAARTRTANTIAQEVGQRRKRHDPLAVLAKTTAAIPDGAWVQRYEWDGGTLRLTGYRSRDTDVAGALRRVPGFANVKSAQSDSVAETSTGQPFDLVAVLGER